MQGKFISYQMMRFKAVLFILTLFVTSDLLSQITVDQSYTIEEYVNDILLSTGVQASNITFTGSESQIGFLEGGEGTIFPLGAGLVLSTEVANNITDLNPAWPEPEIPIGEDVVGEDDLMTIANSVPDLIGEDFTVNTIEDVCILEFDFIATGDTVKFNYSFGSDEYLTWVNSSYNDVFAFFLSGPGITGPYASPVGFPDGAINIALVPESNPPLPITISSVNNVSNTNYYNDNPEPYTDIGMRGFTDLFEAIHTVTCGETYHIKLAIADGSDPTLESMVVLEAGSFTSNSVVDLSIETDFGIAGEDAMYESCGIATITFERPVETILEIEELIVIDYLGSAEMGIDYSVLPDTLVFPPYETTISYQVDAFEDGLAEGTENVILSVLNAGACGGQTAISTIEFFILDPPDPLEVEGFEQVQCGVEVIDLIPDISGGYGYFNYEWSTGDTDSLIAVEPSVTTTYTLVVSDTCFMPSDTAIFHIQFPILGLELEADFEVTCIDEYTLSPDVTGGVAPLIYSWSDGNGIISSDLDYTSITSEDQTYTFTVVDDCGTIVQEEINVSANNPPPVLDLGPDIYASCIDTTFFDAQIDGGIADFEFLWTVDSMPISNSNFAAYQTFESVELQCQVTDACDATSIETVLIHIPDVPMAMTLSSDTLICRGSTIPLIAQASGGEEGITYQWYPEDSDSWNIQVNPSSLTNYMVVATDICGRTISDSVWVDVQDISVSFDVDYVGNNTVQFFPEVEMIPCDSCFYNWEFGDGASSNEYAPAHTYAQLDQYYASLTVSDSIGCTDSYVKLVNAPTSLFVPNAFTPDGDGINEVWKVIGSGFYKFQVFVFNR